jgi:non-ribosomal peptide synthetase component F
MIQSFADRETAQLFYQEKSTRYPMLVRIALRKLIQLNRAGQLRDLAAPPGNRLAHCQATCADSILSGSTTSGGLFFVGPSRGQQMLRSKITIEYLGYNATRHRS